MQLRCGQQQQQGLRDVRTRAAASALIRTPLPNNARPLKPRTQQDRRSLEQLESEKQMCNLISKYTPEYVRSRALETPAGAFAVMARVAHIVTGLGTYFGCLAFDRLTGTEDNIETVRRRAQQLRETLTELGPSFIKAGQVLANRPDIVREDYMNELCILQDDVPPFPDEEAFAIIQEQLGRPLEAVFSSISEQPVAAASLGQVYKAVLRDSGEEVAVKVQRPGIEPLILRDLYVFRALGSLFNAFSQQRLGCNAELVVDEFGEKLLEELDYMQEARNIEEFGRNFASDPTVKIPWVRRDLCGSKVVVMEWIEGIRCTDIPGIRNSGIDVDEFIRVGVVSGLRQLLEFGLFHGDPHPGNIFCLRDGRIAYVDFGNVAQLSNSNKQVLIDAVVHAVNEDYEEMAGDFIKLGFLSPGTDITPIVPALENIWRDSKGQQLADFNFRTVTSKFNELVYQYPIRIPERYSLVIRSLLTQEGICMTLEPEFHFLEVAYPYVARGVPAPRLLSGLVQAQGSNHWGSKSKDCSMSNKRAAYLLKLWDGHVATEFTEKSADAAVATMVPEATVNHVPVITGGAGKEALRAFYRDNFISKMPGDVSLVPLERTVGKDANGVETVVDEFIFKFTHSIKMDWMLPGIEPTGKQVSVPFIVVVKFKGDKLSAERIYWDQATVLRQIGVLQPTTPATTGGDQAKKMADFGSVPSNGLINAAAQG